MTCTALPAAGPRVATRIARNPPGTIACQQRKARCPYRRAPSLRPAAITRRCSRPARSSPPARGWRQAHLSASAVSHGLGRLRRLLNDPLFLRTARGVVPTARALELAHPLGEVLAGARAMIASAAPFAPLTSTRDFTIGTPDGASSAFLRPLLSRLRREAPGVNLRLRQLLPADGGRTAATAWEPAFAALDQRVMDLAIGPFAAVPPRFAARKLRDEDFVIVSRASHPFALAADLATYCSAGHIVVSQTGDAHGFVDSGLAELGRSRRVVLTVPGFFWP